MKMYTLSRMLAVLVAEIGLANGMDGARRSATTIIIRTGSVETGLTQAEATT
jgi:hypothetical protein